MIVREKGDHLICHNVLELASVCTLEGNRALETLELRAIDLSLPQIAQGGLDRKHALIHIL
jgi:hypothetical protein